MSIDANNYLKYIHKAGDIENLSDRAQSEIDTAASRVFFSAVKLLPQANANYQKGAQELATSIANHYKVSPGTSDFAVVLKAANDYLVFKHDIMPFHIDPLPQLSLKEIPNAPVAPYTMLTQSVHDTRSLLAMSEVFTKMPIRNLVALNPERLVLHEMAKNLVLDVALDSTKSADDQIADLSPKLTKEFLDSNPSFAKDMNALRATVEEEIFNNLQSGTAPNLKYEELVKQFTKDVDGQVSTEQKNRAIARRVASDVYQQTAKAKIGAFNIFLSNTLQGYEQIPEQTAQNRRMYMVNGGQASGKGATEEVIKAKALSNGVEWKNMVKINTDSFKKMLLDPKDLADKYALFYGGLTHDEASMIKESIMNEYNARLAKNTAPHLYIDQVWPEEKLFRLGGTQPNGIDVTVVQLPVETSLRLGYTRGQKIGRYEPKATIINGHRGVAIQLIDNLEKAVGPQCNNIQLHFVANTSPTTIQECATYNFKTKQHRIHQEGIPHLEGFFKEEQA